MTPHPANEILRTARDVLLAILSPLLVFLSALVLAATDLLAGLFQRRIASPDAPPDRDAVSIVIPNWNGRDLLEKYLPSVLAAAERLPGSEVMVVDNASEDGSAAFVQSRFPQVRLLALDRNRGFGGGSNAGVEAARHGIVVLLNSDMRVEPDFLPPLVEAFSDETVFGVSCQIFFASPEKRREESGLTQGWWQEGQVRVRHRIDPEVRQTFPCFYPGGGSSAVDRQKFLELGGFDELYAPFYLEDTDLGYGAWKRGWKVLYEPRSIVWHEHRGTIGKKFSEAYIRGVLEKNYLLFVWKNVHSPLRITEHWVMTLAGVVISAVLGRSLERATPMGLWRAFLSLGNAASARWRARRLSRVSDKEALDRSTGSGFHDRFGPGDPVEGRSLRVVFVSPYPLCPPHHGGAVFMKQTLEDLTRLAEVHLIALMEQPGQAEQHRELAGQCRSASFLLRPPVKPQRPVTFARPHAVEEFDLEELHWVIEREIYQNRADVLQLEYTPLAQYGGRRRRIVNALFEHDIYFQSIGRAARVNGAWRKPRHAFEYLRALYYETQVVPRFDLIQVCSDANARYLRSFIPEAADRIVAGQRAGVRVREYCFHGAAQREPGTMLFVGSFRHGPNRQAVEWFLDGVLPRLVERHPGVRFVLAGAEMPETLAARAPAGNVEVLGAVPDVRDVLLRCAVFVCPILSGSGVRVKLLEAFAAGIPVVSTTIGAEGLAERDGVVCRLADSHDAFADAVLELLNDLEAAEQMALRARREVEGHWDLEKGTERLEASYREARARKWRVGGTR